MFTIISATRTEENEYLVETRRVGIGCNGVPQSDLPTEWWGFEDQASLDQAVARKVVLNERAAVDGDSLMGREFRVRVTRKVVTETVEIY